MFFACSPNRKVAADFSLIDEFFEKVESCRQLNGSIMLPNKLCFWLPNKNQGQTTISITEDLHFSGNPPINKQQSMEDQIQQLQQALEETKQTSSRSTNAILNFTDQQAIEWQIQLIFDAGKGKKLAALNDKFQRYQIDLPKNFHKRTYSCPLRQNSLFQMLHQSKKCRILILEQNFTLN